MKENNFSENLKRLRKKKNLTQKDLGDLIHYSDKNISKWEHGKSYPEDDETLDALAEVLDVDKKELLVKHKKNFFETKLFKMLSALLGFTLVVIFIIFFLTRTKAYIIQSDNKNVFIENGNYIVSNNYITFSINNIDTDSKEEIDSIELYKYNDDNSNPILIHRTNSFPITINQNNADASLLKTLSSSVTMIRINYKNNTEQNIKLTFKSSKIKFSDDEKRTSKLKIEEDLFSTSSTAEEYLEKIGFVFDSNSYVKKLSEGCYLSYNKGSYVKYNIYRELSGKIYTLVFKTDELILNITSQDEKSKTTKLKLSDYKEIDCYKNECKTDEEYIGYLIYLKNIINAYEK